MTKQFPSIPYVSTNLINHGSHQESNEKSKQGNELSQRATKKDTSILTKRFLTLLSKKKERYYKYKAEGLCKRNSAKWFKTIYDLAGANGSQGQISPSEATAVLAECFQ